MTEAVKIKADIMWAYLTKPNEMSGKYQVDLCNLSEKASEALESMGIDVYQTARNNGFKLEVVKTEDACCSYISLILVT